ncbi:DMT family transporter [Pseudahrensia aquimaris]|uniref:DMT family transporter n=1 Tax=Pseudahrensia aquimaris TaxID=744461 RepID=A0ABW3FD06_9HYPH
MAYLYLLAAIALEIAGTFCLKLSNGFANPVPTFLVFVFYGLMNVPFILALASLPLSVVYAIWSGVGLMAAAALGFAYFEEPITTARVVFLGITFTGVVGLAVSLQHSA